MQNTRGTTEITIRLTTNLAAKAAFATLTSPLQCHLQLSAWKHNHITHSVKFQALRYENEAFVRGFLQLSKLEDVTTCLRRNSSNRESVSRHAKHNSTASSTKRKNHVEPSVPLRAQSEVQPTTPKTVAHASLLFTAPKAPLSRKNRKVSCKS